MAAQNSEGGQKKQGISLLLKIIIAIVAVLIVAGIVWGPSAYESYKLSQIPESQRQFDAQVANALQLQPEQLQEVYPCVWRTAAGLLIYSSAPYARDVKGYQGRTPMYLVVNKGVIEQVVPATNSESQERFCKLSEQHFFDFWKGKTLEQAAETMPDAISGATCSSEAVAKTVKQTAEKAKDLNSKF